MKNIVKLFGIIALVAVIGFSMIACGDEGGPGGGAGYNPGGSTGDGYGYGWPSSAVLSRWGISGFSVPTGATSTSWAETSSGLVIVFNGTSATDSAVDRWFTNNGWSRTMESSSGNMYEKPPYTAIYVFNYSGAQRGVEVLRSGY